MKTLATMVTERGQVSIPTQVRKQLHLSPGHRVVWEVLSDHECRMTVAAESPVPGAEAMLGYAAKFRKPRRTRDWLTELREGEEA
jgi:AbrB family looped-hinge helix DNA binding protein